MILLDEKTYEDYKKHQHLHSHGHHRQRPDYHQLHVLNEKTKGEIHLRVSVNQHPYHHGDVHPHDSIKL